MQVIIKPHPGDRRVRYPCGLRRLEASSVLARLCGVDGVAEPEGLLRSRRKVSLKTTARPTTTISTNRGFAAKSQSFFGRGQQVPAGLHAPEEASTIIINEEGSGVTEQHGQHRGEHKARKGKRRLGGIVQREPFSPQPPFSSANFYERFA